MNDEGSAIIRPHGGRNYKPRARAENVYSFETLTALQSMTLDDKIGWSRAVIEQTLPLLERPAVAFSAGKDSTVLLHLLRQYRPEIITIYGNTTIEFPECVKFARWLRDEWKLNYYEARPDVSFWWVVEQYGWPLLGKEFGVGGVAHKDSRSKFFADLESRGELTGGYAIQAEVPISSACCTFLKERPSEKVQKQLGVDGVFLGILAAESRRRMFNFLQYGEWYYAKSQKMHKCHPLAIWTDDDIWAYIRRFNVPYAPLYDMGYYNERGEFISHKRNGCMFCGMDIRFPNNHLSIMRRTHPKAWRVLMINKGLGRVLMKLRFVFDDHQMDMFEEAWTTEEYLEHWPCVFDKL
jgi:3'-phosphoadenosine 5'-phosphosulfate sulfotransferase (PAPS reductase)/FAD synthetase